MRAITTLLAQASSSPPSNGGAMPLNDTGRNAVAVLNESLSQRMDVLNHPDSLAQMITQINLVWAAIFIILGGICVLNGYRWHKTVVVILAGLSGIWAGMTLGRTIGDEVIVATCMAVLFAVVAWPFLRYAAAIFGGLAGAFAGANVWTALGYDATNHHLGALIGLIIVGMLAFMTYRAVVIVMTTVGGASLLIIGILTVLLHVETFNSALVGRMNDKPLMVPLIVGVAVIVGAVFQGSGGLKGLKELSDRAEKKTPKVKQAA